MNVIFQELEVSIGRRPNFSEESYKAQLLQSIRKHRNRRNIPFLTPTPTFKFEVLKFIEDWPKLSNNACTKVVQASKDALDAIGS